MSDSETRPPSTREAILKVCESQRTKVERWKTARIRQVKLDGDRELIKLERLIQTLDSKPSRRSGAAGQDRAKNRKSAAALASDRREAIVRLLDERSTRLALGDVRRASRISEFSARSALKRLVKEGKVRRVGIGAATRYESRGKKLANATSPGGPAPRPVTLEGRVLAVIQDRNVASLEELTQASAAAPDEVRRICGGLIAEGEIQMGRRDGHPVYIARRVA